MFDDPGIRLICKAIHEAQAPARKIALRLIQVSQQSSRYVAELAIRRAKEHKRTWASYIPNGEVAP